MKTNKLSLILYLIAGLVIFGPILIVLITGNAFSSFHSKLFLTIAITFVIIGRTLTMVKKAKEDRTVLWGGIGSIIGLLIVLIWSIIG